MKERSQTNVDVAEIRAAILSSFYQYGNNNISDCNIIYYKQYNSFGFCTIKKSVYFLTHIFLLYQFTTTRTSLHISTNSININSHLFYNIRIYTVVSMYKHKNTKRGYTTYTNTMRIHHTLTIPSGSRRFISGYSCFDINSTSINSMLTTKYYLSSYE